MASFLAIPRNLMQAGRGVIDTLSLGCDKLSTTPLWQRTGGVALPYFRTAASYWPQPLRFNVISKEAAGGAISAVLVGALINKARS